MFNDHLSSEAAKERIQERVKEAETYSLQKRLGYGDSRAARWIFLFVLLIVLGVVGLLL
jgi:hypothetical protein